MVSDYLIDLSGPKILEGDQSTAPKVSFCRAFGEMLSFFFLNYQLMIAEGSVPGGCTKYLTIVFRSAGLDIREGRAGLTVGSRLQFK